MRKEKLNTLLDSIYELEGLVHLAITRDDEPAMLPELIRRKSRELMAHAEKATAEESPATETPEPSEPDVTTQVYTDATDEYAADEEYDATDEYEVAEEETEAAPVLSIFQSVPEPESEFVEESASEPEREVTPEPKTTSEPEVTPEPKTNQDSYKFQEYTEPRGRLVFSINDRYRFKRELFHGSDNDFNTTLSRVASMEGYDEAEDYFLNDLQWDEKSPDVIDFLEILKNYFK